MNGVVHAKPSPHVIYARWAVLTDAWLIIAIAVCLGGREVSLLVLLALALLLSYAFYDLATKWDRCHWGKAPTATYFMSANEQRQWPGRKP